MQFEAHVRREITWGRTKFVSKRWIKPGFQNPFAEKNIEYLLHHNWNFDYDRTESSRLAYADFRQFRALHAKKTTYNSTTLVKLAKISLASKFLSWTKLSKNYGIADKTECDEKESFWEVCTKNLGSFGPRTRKEPTYKIEILVKSAKKITVLELLSKKRTWSVGQHAKISWDKTGTFPSPCAKFTRSKE